MSYELIARFRSSAESFDLFFLVYLDYHAITLGISGIALAGLSEALISLDRRP